MIAVYLSILDTDDERSRFEELYYMYRQDMMKTAMSILKNKHDAEDAVHEAFLRVSKYFSQISEIENTKIRGYLVVVVKNVSIDILNDKSKHFADNIDSFENIDDGNSIEKELEFQFDVDVIKKALLQIHNTYYDILFLSEVKGYDINEISTLLNIPYKNAQKRLTRAKNKLYSLIKKEMIENESQQQFENRT